jgi:O-antigen/teichoic acid export membrane protein
MTVARKVARNSLVQFAGRGVTMSVSLAALTLLARYLGPLRFGQYQLVIAFLTLVNVSDLGVATIAVRHLATTDRDPDELMGNVLTVRTLLAFASSALAIAASFALGYPYEIKMAIAVASLSFPLTIFSGSFNATFAANLRMEYAAIGNIAQAVIGLSAMLAVVQSGGGLVRLVVAYDAGVLANSIVCIYFARRFVRPHFRFDLHYSRQVVREALPLGLAVLVITAYGRIDIVLLKAFTDSESVGYYGFAYRVVDLAFPLSFFFVGSVFPLLSSFYVEGKHDEFKTLYQRSHDILSLVGMSIVTVIILFAPPMVRLIGGADYAAAVTSMQVLSMAVALIWLSNLADHGLIAIGRQGALLWIAASGLAVNISVNLVLIPIYGKEGAAAATVITEAAVLLPALFIMSRYIGEAPSFWVAGRLLPIIGVAGVMVYALHLSWETEAVLTFVLFGAGIALMRIVSPSDIKMLLGRHGAVDATVAGARIEAGLPLAAQDTVAGRGTGG